MLKVVVIGSGNVAQHLIQVFKKTEEAMLVQAFARTAAHLLHLLLPQQIATSYNQLAEADIYIIAVTDDAIAQVSSALPFTNRLVVHTSGSVGLSQLNNTNRRGVFYPLQTFSKNKPVDFNKVPLCLESEFEDDYKILEQLALSISSSIYKISSQQRQALHVAAVFAGNFANHMYALADNICAENNIPFKILHPLIQEVAAKVQDLAPQQAQTGPAVRNDRDTIARHLDFLKDENQKEIYSLLTNSIQDTNG
jgi:predicted short-subunit dehydrogenase-like oxidoreductase (DUF2520 family)